ncbi:MAG: glutamine synthetase type III, partial [Bacteroidota bacterium]
MSNLRLKAIESAMSRVPNTVPTPENKISDYFGQNVFDRNTMQKFLSKESFRQVKDAIESG